MAKTSGQLEKERIRRKNRIIISDFTKCYYCKSTGLKDEDHFCPNCAFPQKGTQDSMKRFIWSIKNKHKLLEDQKKEIRKARLTLFILSGFNALISTTFFLTDTLNTTVIVYLVESAIFLGLGLWSRTQPFPAILSGFFVFVVILAISAIADPSTIFSGLLWKAIIIGAFVYGYKAAKEYKSLEDDLQSIKKAKNLNIELS